MNKYLVITQNDSMLLTGEELRQRVVSGEINHYNARVFSVCCALEKLYMVKVMRWDKPIPWVDVIDIFGNRVDTLKPEEDCE